MYIVFEGIDTAGKSTQVALLKEKLDNVVTTKEPGGTEFGMTIREIVLHNESLDHITELLLFLADRREHFHKLIAPALKEGQNIISDRSFISGVAYALSNQSFTLEKLLDLNAMTLDDTLPKAVILFDIPRSTLIERLGAKEIDGIEKRGIDYLLSVQQALIDVTKHLGLKHIIVDASSNIEAIHEEILQFTNTLKENR
jgi:dTMP kinase